MPPDDSAIYEQLCSDFRSLNGFLWQTPLIVMTLTGGLWYAVSSFGLTETGQSSLLAFAAITNVAMIVALVRLRYVMQRIQDQIRQRDGRHVIGPNYTIVACFSAMLALAAIGSLIGSCAPGLYFQPKKAPDCQAKPT